MSFIPQLLDFLLSLLEVFFTKPKIHADNHDYSAHQPTPEQRDQALEAALSFFELDSTTLSRDNVKKKYRRLAKMHHPDRNGNTQESVETSQKINNFNTILNEELDRREGIHHDESEEEEEAPKEPEPATPPKQNNNNRKQSKSAARRAKKRQRRRQREREERQRAQMNEAMKKEEAEIRRQRHEVKREQQTKTKAAFRTKMKQGLDTKEGRERAYREWKEAVDNMQAVSNSESDTEEKEEEEKEEEKKSTTEATNGSTGLDGIDGEEADETPDKNNDDDKSAPPEDPAPQATAVPAKAKPLNLVMECCMKEIVVALRMGHTDVVLDRMQCDMMENIFKKVVLEAVLDGRDEMDQSEIAVSMSKSFTQPLDEDGNTLLHYAVYYESSDTIGAFYCFANSFGILAEVFLKENAYGMIPLDFVQCCVKDESLPARMKVHTDAAREDLASKQVWPCLKKSARRLWGVICNLNVAALLGPINFVASYLIGRRLFRCGRIASFWIALVSIFSSGEPEKYEFHRGQYAATLFSTHLTWRWWCYLGSFLSWTMLVVLISVAFLGYFVWPKSEWCGLICVVPPALVFYPSVCLLEALEQSFRFPAAIKSGSEVERSACLLVFTVLQILVKLAVQRFHGGAEEDELRAEEITDEFASFA